MQGRHSVLSVLQGGALAGLPHLPRPAAPASQLLFEPHFCTSGMRLPLVMTIVTRDGITHIGVGWPPGPR